METLALQTQTRTATTKSDMPSAEEVLQKIKQQSAVEEAKRNAEAEAQAILKAKEEADALTDFDKSLFENGNVDFKNYIGVQQLFDKFRDEATNGVEVRFADYQQSLLHLLKHCYGYMYALKTDSERYTNDIQHINNAISSLNRTSNKGNSLEAKIVKLAFRDSVDRKRISTYAKLLTNAWCKGELENSTDDNGCVLPKHFEKEVMAYGGISDFSRMSAKSIEAQKQLEAEGYNNLSDKKIDCVTDALSSGTFEWNGETCSITKNKPSIKLNEKFSSKFRDGQFVNVPMLYNREAKAFSLINIYYEEGTDIADKVKLDLFKTYTDKIAKAKLKEKSKS